MGADKAERRKPSTGRSLFSKQEESNGSSFDWGSCDSGRLLGLIEFVTGRGGAIRFGYSRDGKAGSLGIYFGDSRDTLWLRPSEDPEVTFRRIEEVLGEYKNTGGKAPE